MCCLVKKQLRILRFFQTQAEFNKISNPNKPQKFALLKMIKLCKKRTYGSYECISSILMIPKLNIMIFLLSNFAF